MSVYVNVGDPVYVQPEATNSSRVFCEAGDAAMGGGHFQWSGATSHAQASRPIGSTNPIGWVTSFHNESSSEGSLMTAMVTCLDLTP
jgi:hypothetical protein